MKTLREILIHANSLLDLEAALPTGTELNLRSSFADRAVWDAAATGQLKEFKRLYETSITTPTLATLPLPTDFREFQDVPKIYSGGSWNDYEEIKPEDKYSRSEGERYCYVLGTPGNYNLILNSPLVGTFSTVYQRFPSGLLTLSDRCELPDPMYVVTKVESYVLQGRGDDRFPFINSQAEQRLLNMMGRGMKNPGGGVNTTPTPYNPLS